MLFWILAGFLTLLTVLTLVWPALRDKETEETSRYFNLQVYENQLNELDSDYELGRLKAEELHAMRIEIQRRILEENYGRLETDTTTSQPKSSYILVTLIISFLIPSFSLAVYSNLGAPNLPDAPFSQKAANTPIKTISSRAPNNDSINKDQHPAIDDMISNLEKKLLNDPSKIEDWELLGRSFLIRRQYGKAVDIFLKATDISPSNMRIRANLAEALVLSAEGRVSPEALKQIKLVEENNPKDPRVRYYLGLADYQQKNYKKALERWMSLQKDTPSNAPWKKMLQERIRLASKEANTRPEIQGIKQRAETDPDNLSKAGSVNSTSILQKRFSGPNSDEVKAAESMSQKDRQAMINSMVKRLAERLKKTPQDVDGWVRLSRSYRVLGQSEKSVNALREAVQLAPNRVDIQMAYARLLFPEGTDERKMSVEFKKVIKHVLSIAPETPEALYFGGLISKLEGDKQSALNYWTKLLTKMGPDTPARDMIETRIEKLR